MKRVLTTVVAVPILIYVLWYAPPYYFIGAVVIATLLGVREFNLIAEQVGCRVDHLITWLGSLLVLAGFFVGKPEYTVGILALVLALALMVYLARREPLGVSLASTSATLASVVYVAVFMGYLISVRLIDGGATPLSAKLLSFFFLVVWAGDTGAFCVGRTLGKHKLAPVISPKKTIEGTIGGFGGNLLAALVSKYWFFPELKLSHAIGLSLIMGAVGQIGDLCESMFKRGAHIKDTASIIPGHGGMLDRLDSLLFNAPILYYYYRLFLAS
jgi:phosphatidate cytidylyltransferase